MMGLTNFKEGSAWKSQFYSTWILKGRQTGNGTAYTQTAAEIRNYPIPASNRELLYRLLDGLNASVPDWTA